MADPFENDWTSVASTPTDRFRSAPFQEIYSWAGSWELPNEIKVVVRFIHESGKIEEKAFSSYKKAEDAVQAHDGEYLAYDSDYLHDSFGT